MRGESVHETLGALLQSFRGKKWQEAPAHLRQWLKDAEAFGIPQNVQKGLLFFSGIGVGVQGMPEGHSKEIVLARMSRYLRYDRDSVLSMPDEVGEDFDSDSIGALLLDLIQQADSDTKPTTQVSHAFYSKVGDCIEGFEPEVIIVSGIRFFNRYFQADRESTVRACRYALQIRPPHHAWIYHAFLDDLEAISAAEVFTKAMTAFSSPHSTEFILALAVYQKMTLNVTPQERIDALFLCQQAISCAQEIAKAGHLSKAITQYAQELRPLPGYAFFRDIPEEAAVDLLTLVQREWGYTDIAQDYERLSLGEQMDRLCCLVVASMRDATWRVIPPTPVVEKKLSLDLWKLKAEELAIPENIQKGLLFFASIDRWMAQPKNEEEVDEVLERITARVQVEGDSIKVPEDISVRFQGAVIDRCLERVIESHPGNLEAATAVAQKFFAEIGEAIEGSDLEDILVSGIVFYLEESETEVLDLFKRCKYALGICPLHMRCLNRLIQIDLDQDKWEQSGSMPALALVATGFDVFLDEAALEAILAVIYRVPELEKRTFLEIREYVAQYTKALKSLGIEKATTSKARRWEAEGELNLFREPEDEFLEDIKNALLENWGYTQFPQGYHGAQCDYVCCVLDMMLVDQFMKVALVGK